MSSLQLKITHHIKTWEDLNLKVKRRDPNTEITEMLELSEKDSKAIVKMLQQAITNTLETNEKNRKPQERNKSQERTRKYEK